MKKKIVWSIFTLFIIGLVVLNISVTFGEEKSYNIMLDHIQALAEEDESDGFKELKSIACADGKGYRKKCEFEPNPKSMCHHWDETQCESGNSDTGDNNGNTQICQQQGHNMVTHGLYQKCTRCNYQKEIHRHDWKQTGTQKIAGVTYYNWICTESKCKKTDQTLYPQPPSRD